jgi:hypothetical protein
VRLIGEGWEGGKFGRSVRSKIIVGQIGRQICEGR